MILQCIIIYDINNMGIIKNTKNKREKSIYLQGCDMAQFCMASPGSIQPCTLPLSKLANIIYSTVITQ
jgi:hypothetical protein